MAQIIEARLTDEFMGSQEIPGIIHSKFHNVLNVLFRMPNGNNRLVTIITLSTKGIPDSITVKKEYFEKIILLPVNSRLIYRALSIRFNGIAETLEGDYQCLRQSEIVIKNLAMETEVLVNCDKYLKKLDDFSSEKNCRNGLSVLGLQKKEEIVTNLQNFSKAWLEHDLTKMEAILLKHIGMGIGLTPSCDDAFIGIIAVYSGAKLYAHALSERTKKCSITWINLQDIKSITSFNKLLFNRTTDVSLKYLCCSQEGRFSDGIIDLIREIFSGSEKNLEACINSVSLVGGSSGMDTLFGTGIACRELCKIL